MSIAFICILLLFCFLIGFGIQSAFGDKYSSLGMAFKGEPFVCIFEPHPEYTDKQASVIQAAENAVQLWEDALYTHSPSGNWNLDTVVIPIEWHHTANAYSFPMCDILIAFEYSSENQSLGYTHMNFSKSWHKYSHATIFLNDFRATQHYDLNLDTGKYEHVNTTYKLTEFSMTAVQNIITHEFGHTLGLGHYKITDYPIYADDRPWLEASVMYYAINPDIQEVATPKYVDVKMLEELYYSDGFGGNSVIKLPLAGYYSPGDEDICTFKCKVWQ